MVVAVGAVPETEAGSAMFKGFNASVADVPLNVCVAVNVCAVFVSAMLAPASVVAPVPPEAIGSVPVVSAEVDVAYTAPPDVNTVSPVPPPVVGSVPLVRTDVELAKIAVPDVNTVSPVPPLVVANVPARVIAPEVAELGVKHVVPAEKVVTGADVALDANSLTVPPLSL